MKKMVSQQHAYKRMFDAMVVCDDPELRGTVCFRIFCNKYGLSCSTLVQSYFGFEYCYHIPLSPVYAHTRG